MSYSQEVYDAVRSRISGGDVWQAVRDVAWQAFDISNTRDILQQEFAQAAYAMQRPFVLLRPAIYPDGNQWCALYGDDLMTGIAGFGDTPDAAADAFDAAWRTEKPPVIGRPA
jgi:hypothetical protein